MGWADYYIQKDQEAKKQAEQAQQLQAFNEAIQTRKARQIIDGVDPALRNVQLPTVKAPISNKLLRGFNIATDSLVKGATIGLAGEDSPIDKLAGKITDPLIRRLGKEPVKPNLIPTPETKAEKAIAGISGFAGAALPISGASKLGVNLLKNVPIKNQLAKSLASTSIAGGLYGGAEGAIQGENLKEISKSALTGAATWPLMELGARGVGKVAGNLLPKLPKKAGGELPQTVQPNPLLQQMRNTLRGGDITRLSPTIQDNPLLRQMKNTYEVGEPGKFIPGKPLPSALQKTEPIANNATLEDDFWRVMDNGADDVAMADMGGGGIKKGKWDQSDIQFNPETDVLPDPQSKIKMNPDKEKFSFKKAWDKFYTKVVDNQKALGDLGKATDSDIGIKAMNTKNAGGIVDYNILEGLVDKNGNKVGESLKEVTNRIPKGQEEEFWTYMSQRHNIDRAGMGKPVQANYTPEMSELAVKQAEAAHPEWKQAGDDVVKWIDDFMQTWGVDTGIVNPELYAELRQTYKSYFPTQRDFSQLENAIPDGLSQKFVDLSTPIKKAKGSERDIRNPIENIMNLVNRTIRTAKYNEVGQDLMHQVIKNPEKMKPFAEWIEGDVKNINKTPDNVIAVLENGEKFYLQINDKALLDALHGLPKNVNNIKYVTAVTQGVKNLITQKNPIFAVRNLARDLPTAYVYGSEANPLKFGRDMFKAGKEIATNGPMYQRYRAVGGGSSNFFNQGEVSKAAQQLGKTAFSDSKLNPVKWIENFNNSIESAPRLAEFTRVFEQTGDINKALHAAGEVTVNFSRGGTLPKTLDKAGGMYINASVQGLDRFFRGFKDPQTAIKTLGKSGVAVSAPTVALYLMNKDNPNYQALDNRTKDTYYLFPDPSDDGKTFIKLPKSRELGALFGALFERVGRQIAGQGNSFKGFGNTLKTNFGPADPINNSMLSPILALDKNKDFADRAIVPQSMLMQKLPQYLQYDEKTTSLAKAIGKATTGLSFLNDGKGLSPKQIDYVIKSYTGVIGQLGQPALTPGGSSLKSISTQFIANPLYSNQGASDFYDKLNKLTATAAERNELENIPSKTVTPEEDIKNSMSAVSSVISRGNKKIKAIQASDAPDKEAQVEAIKSQINQLYQEAIVANDAAAMNALEKKTKNYFK